MAEDGRVGALGTMPQPPDVPLYVSIDVARELAGVSYEMMSAWANAAVDPIPHIVTGKKKLIRVAAIPAYAATRESA